MTQRAPTEAVRTRPTRRSPLLVVLILLVYGAGANVGAGTVLFLAAGMAVGTAWSVTRFLRHVDDLRVLTDRTIETIEGRSTLPVSIAVPPGVIGVARLLPSLPDDVARELLAELEPPSLQPDGTGDQGEHWAVLPRSATSAQVGLPGVLARGEDQQLRLELEVTDVFGLVRRRWTLTGPTADVTPATGAAAAFRADSVEGDEEDWIAHALAANGAPGTELRPWRPGEAIRAVHWPASERADQLLVRPRGPETTQRRTLTVEDRDWSRAALDARCRDLTATAVRLAQAGVLVEVAAAGRLLPWGHEARCLLASLRPNAASIAGARREDG